MIGRRNMDETDDIADSVDQRRHGQEPGPHSGGVSRSGDSAQRL